MKKRILMSTLALGTVLTGLSTQVQPAFSGTLCAADIQNLVTPLDPNPLLQPSPGTCQVGSTSNDNPLPGQVNADLMFGKSDWFFKAKDEGEGGENSEGDFDLDIDFGFEEETTSGTWDISDEVQMLIDDGINFTSLMLVLKGPNAFNYVGYLLKTNATSGTWSTPFDGQDVSHISLYYRTGEPIPTPALLPGLIGMGVAAFRKKQGETAEEA